MERITVRLPETMFEEIDKHIPNEFSSLSDFIRTAILNLTKKYDLNGLRKEYTKKVRYH